MDNFKKSVKRYLLLARDFFKERGAYVAALIALVGIGIAAAVAFAPDAQGGGSVADAALPTPTTPPVSAVGSSNDERLSGVSLPTPSPSPTPTELPDFTPAPRTPTPTPDFREFLSSPVDGKILWGFAVNELVYSQTLKQWMTHCGVDVSAKKGDEVRCILGGTVERVYSDDAMGVTVEIAHTGKLKSVYSNLCETPPVKEGQKLNQRDVIGYIGATAISECELPSHLHFEILKNGEAIDPETMVIFEKNL